MPIILIILKLIIFWIILFFFGYQIGKWLFRGGQIEKLIALAGLIGAGLYVFLINTIGHFIPIGTTFYLVLFIFIIVGGVLFFINKPKIVSWGIDKKWKKILLVMALLLIVVTFIVDNRYPLGGDQLLLGSMPTAATIAEGNFPPKAIWVPSYPLRYHYGSHLFAAAIYKTTGVPLYVSYDIQVAVLVGVLFLLGFILVREFTKNNKKALISSVLMLFAGSLVFLRGINGISVLYNKYFLHQQILAPFKFVFEMVDALFSGPAIKWMSNYPTNALSFVLIMGVISLYFTLVKQNNKKLIIIIVPLLATLALFSETFFAVLCVLLVVYPIAFGLIKKDWAGAKKFLFISLLIVIIATPIAFIQGGVLTYYLGRDGYNLKLHQVYGYTDVELLKRGFEINQEPWILMTRLGDNNRLPIYDLRFLLQWGLSLVLIIAAVIYFWKKQSEYIIFLELSFFAFFLIPFLIIFPLELCSTERFFFSANLFGGLIIGLFLAEQKRFKKAIIFIVAMLMAQGIIFQLIFLTIGYPPGKWNNADEFFIKSSSFQWVKKNTNIEDYFLILNPRVDFELGPNLKFVVNTGRMAPIYSYGRIADTTKDKLIDVPQSYIFKQLLEKCESKPLKDLKYKYLYVDENWPEGFEAKCLANNHLELKFETEEGIDFVRIYQVL
ncbi:MAG: DUF2298 domain-containing protein [Nanoarchaeota archaeon]|nr:DUF2298 domain-containing protein [Nanoarchaeota archaeon]